MVKFSGLHVGGRLFKDTVISFRGVDQRAQYGFEILWAPVALTQLHGASFRHRRSCTTSVLRADSASHTFRSSVLYPLSPRRFAPYRVHRD